MTRLAGAVHTLVAFVSDHAAWAYAVVGVAALLEAVPVLGSIVPGTSIIVAISALIGSGRLSVIAILFCAILGAAIGDGTAYLVGHRFKHRILESWPLAGYPNIVAQSAEFFRRHGTSAVFFGRFVAPIRAFVPITAGALAMTPQRFFAVDLPAVALWAVAHVLAGAFAGSLLGEWGERIKPYGVLAVAAIAVVAFLVWVRKHWRQCAPDARGPKHHADAAATYPRETDFR